MASMCTCGVLRRPPLAGPFPPFAWSSPPSSIPIDTAAVFVPSSLPDPAFSFTVSSLECPSARPCLGLVGYPIGAAPGGGSKTYVYPCVFLPHIVQRKAITLALVTQHPRIPCRGTEHHLPAQLLRCSKRFRTSRGSYCTKMCRVHTEACPVYTTGVPVPRHLSTFGTMSVPYRTHPCCFICSS